MLEHIQDLIILSFAMITVLFGYLVYAVNK